MKKIPLLMMVVAILDEQGESSRVLLEMRLVVYRPCLQRPKDVVFEGLGESFGYSGGGERKKKIKKNEENVE